MPRGGSASRKQQGVANQHNTKHENGLVGPGRKIQRERSNGHVNGNSKSSSNSRPSTPPVPSTPPANGHPRTHQDIATDDAKMAVESLRRSSLSAYSEASSTESYHQTSSGPVSPEQHRQIDVNATKNPAVHRDNGPLGFAYTVLKSCPLYDTIAILIVLLQLPPTFLSIIHLLFATLTFVPPTSGHGFSFTDIFEGSIGTPSIATVIVVDMLVLLVWLFLWSPVQNFALDLAQTVIAMTLGGGTNGKEAGTNNVLVCLGVIGASHFARNGGVKSSGLRSLLSSSSHGIFGSDPDDPLEAGPQLIEKGAYTWARSILAIHILAQGVVRFVRQWYVRREKRDAAGTSLGDPEAGKGSLTHSDTSVHDSNSNTPNGQIPDSEATCPLPTNDKILSLKKKRKHIAQVRTRQPLWAALASTKVVMVKEYETSHSAAESAGTNATDINNLGSAPFNTEADRIWITYVGFDEVCFNTSYFPNHHPADHCEGNNEVLSPPGIDPSKPFFVRVNRSIWQPTRISVMAEPEGEISKETRWTGEIFGLAAMSNYECEFVSTTNGALLFSTSIRTLQAPKMGTAVAATISPAPQRSLQPDSPITTLRTSIAAAEVKLNEERNRQKRDRREQKTKLNGLRKELDRLANSIASSGNSDDRQRQKVQQSNLHMKQAEDALLTIIADIEALENLPDDDVTDWNRQKKDWRSAREVHQAAQLKSDESKQAAERAVQALNSELTTLQQKRERMQGRITKLAGEHERITDANARGLDEAQRRERETEQKTSDRLSHEMGYIQQLNQTRQFIDRLHETRDRLWADIEALHHEELYISQAAQQASASPNASMPNLNLYEEINSSYPWNPPALTQNHNASTNAQSANVMATVNVNANPYGRMRGRSSSMLSNVSGFTQSSDELARAMAEAEDERAREGNGGNSRGSANGSVGDPRSPAPRQLLEGGGDEWV